MDSRAGGDVDDLGRLKHKCERLLSLHGYDPQLGKALSGLYYSFKCLKFFPGRTRELLEGDYDQVASTGICWDSP